MSRSLLTSVLALSLGAISCDLMGFRDAAPPSRDAADERVWEVRAEPALAELPAPVPAEAPEEGGNVVDLIAETLSEHQTGLSHGELGRVAETIVSEAEARDFDPGLVLAVIHVESRFDAFALSPAGAFGLMQILPSTGEELAARLGLAWSGPHTLFDPVANVKLGVAYLDELLERYGDLATALAAYNWGPGRIDRFLRRGRPLPVSYSDRVLERLEEGGSAELETS